MEWLIGAVSGAILLGLFVYLLSLALYCLMKKTVRDALRE